MPEVKHFRGYRCPVCESAYEDKEDAISCCGSLNEVDVYECSLCGEQWSSERDAEACCEK